METQPQPFNHNSQQILTILQTLKQASHDLHTNHNQTAIKPLLELHHESDPILSDDPHLKPLKNHLKALENLINKSNHQHGLKSFLLRHEISNLAASIELEIDAWIDREFVEFVTKTLKTATKDEVLIDLIVEFEQRIARGFDRDLQESILKAKVFNELESILCNERVSNKVREASAFAITELIRFNKDVFVGEVLVGEIVHSMVLLASVRSLKALTMLIRSIKSPIVDEIEANGEMIKIIDLLGSDDVAIKSMALECVLTIGYFGRKETIDAMLKAGLVKKLVELQRTSGTDSGEKIERNSIASCVARFAVQLEVGEGLRRREKRALKQEVLRRVREAHVCEAEAATIIAEVLWGASP